jgi:hypothetical protein
MWQFQSRLALPSLDLCLVNYHRYQWRMKIKTNFTRPYLNVTAFARVASSTDARVTADVVHARPAVDAR